jgi:hypothetical protein
MIIMFATFDDTAFPLVRIRLGSIKDDDDFFIFLKQCDSYDIKYENYTFVFDATNVGYISVKYAYKIKDFIRERKACRNNKYLERSIVIASTWYIRGLLRLIFSMETPTAPVYMIDNKMNVQNLLENLCLDYRDFTSNVVCFLPA